MLKEGIRTAFGASIPEGYYLNQVWSGRGGFKHKLRIFDLVADTICLMCSTPEDTADHAVWHCIYFMDLKTKLVEELGMGREEWRSVTRNNGSFPKVLMEYFTHILTIREQQEYSTYGLTYYESSWELEELEL